MRTRATNFLQVVVLITGITYLLVGLAFYASPLRVLQVFAENVSESWLDLVMDNELVAPLYILSRGLAALLISSGLSMIMPLFDPLKYRGLIYFNGLIFPFLASVLFIKNGFFLIMEKKRVAAAIQNNSSLLPTHDAHEIVLVLSAIFLIVFFLNLSALIITWKKAREGIE
jgi:hypothetical protein